MSGGCSGFRRATTQPIAHYSEGETLPRRVEASQAAKIVKPVKPVKAPAKKRAKLATKNDPKLVSAARELRDRWLDQVNAGGEYAILPAPRYEVGRLIDDRPPIQPTLRVEQAVPVRKQLAA